MEIIRATELWQQAGAYYVRIQSEGDYHEGMGSLDVFILGYAQKRPKTSGKTSETTAKMTGDPAKIGTRSWGRGS